MIEWFWIHWAWNTTCLLLQFQASFFFTKDCCFLPNQLLKLAVWELFFFYMIKKVNSVLLECWEDGHIVHPPCPLYRCNNPSDWSYVCLSLHCSPVCGALLPCQLSASWSCQQCHAPASYRNRNKLSSGPIKERSKGNTVTWIFELISFWTDF
mgnify:CR=1 FL=1